jgi:predicted enzyme related to lactoylglutathione lyase
MGNPFVHIELHSGDVKAAKKFYRGLFDWKLEDQKMGPGMVYTTIGVGKGTAGGMMAKSAEEPAAWLPYVLVDDVDKTVAKARKLGANLIVPGADIPGVGRFGIFLDPSGAAIGVFQAKRRAPARKPAAKARTPKRK